MDSVVRWARTADQPSEHTEKMLSVAVTNYGKQTDWFLHHYESGIKQLGAVLAAQFSLTSIALTTSVVPRWLAIAALIFLGLLGPFFAISTIRSAQNSYRAAIEYAVLITKSLWALGLTGVIDIPGSRMNTEKPPAANDEVFYIERHVNNHVSPQSTNEIVDGVIRTRYNTFYWAKLVIGMFAVAVITMAIAGSVAVSVKMPAPH